MEAVIRPVFSVHLPCYSIRGSALHANLAFGPLSLSLSLSLRVFFFFLEYVHIIVCLFYLFGIDGALNQVYMSPSEYIQRTANSV